MCQSVSRSLNISVRHLTTSITHNRTERVEEMETSVKIWIWKCIPLTERKRIHKSRSTCSRPTINVSLFPDFSDKDYNSLTW